MSRPIEGEMELARVIAGRPDDIPLPSEVAAARAVLASDWLAARDARVRHEGEVDGLRAAANEWPGAQVAKRPIAQWLRDRSSYDEESRAARIGYCRTCAVVVSRDHAENPAGYHRGGQA